MKKNIYKLKNIDCAACALQIEDKVAKLNGITSSNLSYMFQKLYVTFDEKVVSDEEIEECIHKSLSGVRIVEKNNEEFIDTYEEVGIFKKILFRGRNKQK